MSRNVIKFDPNDRKRKRRTPAQSKNSRKKFGLRGVLHAVSIGLLFSAMGLAVYWIFEDNIQEPITSFVQTSETVSVSVDDTNKVFDRRISGTATVIDGDTIEIHGQRIRLDGYDAPERGNVCGTVNVYQKASLALADLVGRRTVTCDVKGEDRYNRKVADCEVGGQSIAEYVVEQGWARDWPKYSNRAYADEERRARSAKRGIWGLNCPSNLWGSRSYN